MADTLQRLLRSRAEHDAIAVKHDDQVWTWREHVAAASAHAAAVLAEVDPSRPVHVGTLLGNTPDMLTALAAAARGVDAAQRVAAQRRGRERGQHVRSVAQQRADVHWP